MAQQLGGGGLIGSLQRSLGEAPEATVRQHLEVSYSSATGSSEAGDDEFAEHVMVERRSSVRVARGGAEDQKEQGED